MVIIVILQRILVRFVLMAIVLDVFRVVVVRCVGMGCICIMGCVWLGVRRGRILWGVVWGMLGMLVCGVFNLVSSVWIAPIVYHVRLVTCHYSNPGNVSANANPATIHHKNQTQTTQIHPPTTPSVSSKHVSHAPQNAKPVKITTPA